jgi:hypothetical protein
MNGILTITIDLLEDDNISLLLSADLSSNSYIKHLINKELCYELNHIIPDLRKKVKKELTRQGIENDN